MNLNYDRQFEEIKKQRAGSRLLLHVCCAPCATYCLTRILDAFDVTLHFHNDNIFPQAEWGKTSERGAQADGNCKRRQF